MRFVFTTPRELRALICCDWQWVLSVLPGSVSHMDQKLMKKLFAAVKAINKEVFIPFSKAIAPNDADVKEAHDAYMARLNVVVCERARASAKMF